MSVSWLLQLESEARDLLAASLALAISLFTAIRWAIATEVGDREQEDACGVLIIIIAP